MKNKLTVLTIVLSMLAIYSCKDKQSSYKKINKVEKTSIEEIHKIVVNDFMDAGGYTYLNVNEGGKDYWMAIPNTKVEKGATYFYTGGMLMKNFESKELNKKFDLITFSEGISTSEEAINKTAVKNPHSNAKDATDKVVEVNIEQPANGTSIADLFEKKETLKNQEVVVKGKVVKVNSGILDRNWIHIVDGTSFETKKDLTITSNEVVKVGDTVTFKAKVVLDKDFGGGYIYALLLEEGELVK